MVIGLYGEQTPRQGGLGNPRMLWTSLVPETGMQAGGQGGGRAGRPVAQPHWKAWRPDRQHRNYRLPAGGPWKQPAAGGRLRMGGVGGVQSQCCPPRPGCYQHVFLNGHAHDLAVMFIGVPYASRRMKVIFFLRRVPRVCTVSKTVCAESNSSRARNRVVEGTSLCFFGEFLHAEDKFLVVDTVSAHRAMLEVLPDRPELRVIT